MGNIQDSLQDQAPQRCYLFPTNDGAIGRSSGRETIGQQQSLFFQYWPGSLQDDYGVEYAEHSIPGGSHPLYQWVGGRGRTITFEALFTAELNLSNDLGGGTNFTAATTFSSSPSGPFSVNVSAALSKIRSWMMPKYSQGGRLGETDPPKILTLVFPNTKLAGSSDLIQVILKSAPITIESWFPNGEIRVATVQLTFSEIVQSAGGGQANSTKVTFIGRDDFETEGNNYRFRGLSDRPFTGG